MNAGSHPFVLGRSAGPIGRWFRLIAGILFLIYAAWDWELLTESHSPAFYGTVAMTFAVSEIVLFFIRYGGCEVVALPTLLLHRRYTVYCPWNVVDAVEKVATERTVDAERQNPAGLPETR